ncbi:hypothetical protein, partial [Streptomyces jumonjinensis]|uniref:hypothetical protein n=1 Tax=Streptomyces jumonjinensis TaxID=1945 RepID=UPI0037AC3F33
TSSITTGDRSDLRQHLPPELRNLYGLFSQRGIRCPMLQVNPKMLPRLAEIEKDLLLRRKRAQEEHWLGEVEGIDATLTFLRAKQAEAARLSKRPTTNLGIPRPRPEEIQ